MSGSTAAARIAGYSRLAVRKGMAAFIAKRKPIFRHR
jgi:hypothetical protein